MTKLAVYFDEVEKLESDMKKLSSSMEELDKILSQFQSQLGTIRNSYSEVVQAKNNVIQLKRKLNIDGNKIKKFTGKLPTYVNNLKRTETELGRV